jgi:hypothetical protein
VARLAFRAAIPLDPDSDAQKRTGSREPAAIPPSERSNFPLHAERRLFERRYVAADSDKGRVVLA